MEEKLRKADEKTDSAVRHLVKSLRKEANSALAKKIAVLQAPTPKFSTVEENNAFLYGYTRARNDIMRMLEE